MAAYSFTELESMTVKAGSTATGRQAWNSGQSLHVESTTVRQRALTGNDVGFGNLRVDPQ